MNIKQLKDNLYYYFAEKNWGVRREYGPYVDTHREEHVNKRWKHWWILIKLNWHYRILRKTTMLYPEVASQSKRRLPYLDGSESEISHRRPVLALTKDLLQYDIISFDIFDTLIFRPFAKPADLFMIVGKRLNRTEFYRIRTDAEKRARELATITKGNREVTIEDIYAVIEERTGLSKEIGIQTEFEVELQYCFANPYMKRVFKLLQEQKKTIIIVSDMYFPESMMKKLLSNAGYSGYEKLYVSCDYGCSKSSKGLYQYVKRDYEGKKIVHIGDNFFSDIKCAQEIGLDVKYYKNVHEIGNQYRTDGMSALVGSAYSGIVNTHLHNGIKIYSPYYEYGFIYGGLYILGFCNWIHKKVKLYGIEKVIFLSRDGDIYQKVFNKMFDDTPNEYFLWSRIANSKYTLVKNREDFLRRVVFYRTLRSEAIISISSLLDSLSLGRLKEELPKYGIQEQTLVVRENVRRIEEFFIKNWNLVLEIYSDEKKIIHDYIVNKIKDCKKIAIIDVGWLGSGPLGLKYLIEDEFKLLDKVYCFQAAAGPPHPTDIITNLLDESIEAYIFSHMHNRNLFDAHKTTNKGVNNIFFELFTQAKYPSYSGVNKNGLFLFDIPEVENYKIVDEIQSGILDFCQKFMQIFRGDSYLFNVSGYDAYLPYRFIIRNLKFLKEYFGKICYARGVSGDYEKQHLESINDIMKSLNL